MKQLHSGAKRNRKMENVEEKIQGGDSEVV